MRKCFTVALELITTWIINDHLAPEIVMSPESINWTQLRRQRLFAAIRKPSRSNNGNNHLVQLIEWAGVSIKGVGRTVGHLMSCWNSYNGAAQLVHLWGGLGKHAVDINIYPPIDFTALIQIYSSVLDPLMGHFNPAEDWPTVECGAEWYVHNWMDDSGLWLV